MGHPAQGLGIQPISLQKSTLGPREDRGLEGQKQEGDGKTYCSNPPVARLEFDEKKGKRRVVLEECAVCRSSSRPM